jgi:threonine dehydrogenase-like Zn-dependent dehydrogenase
LIIGAGGLGMALLFWCNVLRIDSVCVADIHQDKKAQVQAFEGKFLHVDELNKLNNKFNVIFETSGVTQNVVNAFKFIVQLI